MTNLSILLACGSKSCYARNKHADAVIPVRGEGDIDRARRMWMRIGCAPACDDQVLGDCATSAAQPNQSPSNPERIDRSEHRNLFVALHMERAQTHA